MRSTSLKSLVTKPLFQSRDFSVGIAAATAHYPKHVRIVEVGPRDGLQNEKMQISFHNKLQLIHLLKQTGLKNIEAGSFVSPKWVPQMADAEHIFSALAKEKDDGVCYSALTPNLKGLESALKLGVKEVAVFGAASEGFSQKNINCSIEESLKRFEPVCKLAIESNVRVRGYVSCVLGCPYEGHVDASKVEFVTQKLLEMGCYEVSLGDTIGVGTPGSTHRLLDRLIHQSKINPHVLAVHFHDTYGQALANIAASLSYGISVVDSAVSGLGGCPYAAGASGNVATEDVLYMLNGLNIHTGVDLEKVLIASKYIDHVLARKTNSRVGAALGAKAAKEEAKKEAKKEKSH